MPMQLEEHIDDLRKALSDLPKRHDHPDFQGCVKTLDKKVRTIVRDIQTLPLDSFEEVTRLLQGVMRRLEAHKDEHLTQSNFAGACYRNVSTILSRFEEAVKQRDLQISLELLGCENTGPTIDTIWAAIQRKQERKDMGIDDGSPSM